MDSELIKQLVKNIKAELERNSFDKEVTSGFYNPNDTDDMPNHFYFYGMSQGFKYAANNLEKLLEIMEDDDSI